MATSQRPPFTRQDGLDVQNEQLHDWKAKLDPACFSALVAAVLKENAKLTDKSTGYDVFRGTSLDGVVANWRPAAVTEEDKTPPTPFEIARSFAAVTVNGLPDTARPFTFGDYATHCEIEELTRSELLDIEFMCERVDTWISLLA